MKRKKIMIVSLLLLAIFAIGAVSASEDVDTLAVEEADDLSVDELSEDIVTEGESNQTPDAIIDIKDWESYSTISVDNHESVFDIEISPDTNGTVVISSGDKELFNKELKNFNKTWHYENENRGGCNIYNYDLNYLDELTDGVILKVSFISENSQTFSDYYKFIKVDDDKFKLGYCQNLWIWDKWAGPLYLDTDKSAVNIDVWDTAIDGTFYVTAHGREYKYEPYFEDDGVARHNWKLSSFDITEPGLYPVLIEYVPNEGFPREIVRSGVLNVTKFNNDTFRVIVDTHNHINLYCPDNKEGIVSIFLKYDWVDEYSDQATETYEITNNDYNNWKSWSFGDLGCEEETGYHCKIVITNSTGDEIYCYEDGFWYNEPWDIHITPAVTLEVYDNYYDNGNQDDGILGVYIPEKDNIYNGTIEIKKGNDIIYTKEISTRDMSFDDNSRDYRYWLSYRDIKSKLVNYNNAALTFSFYYNNTQIAQPFVMVNVINKKNYEIELERAFSADIYNDWGGPLYSDYNLQVVNLDFRYPEVNGIFYVSANGKEYQYQANFDEEGRAWHCWVLSSFDIDQEGSYPVTIEYADDTSSPRITILSGELNVVEYNYDVFRVVGYNHNQTFSIYCPDGSEGSSISIFIKYDWDDDYPSKATKTFEVTPGITNGWLDLTFEDVGLKWDRENIVQIKILNGTNEMINPYETSIWYDYEPYDIFMPTNLSVKIGNDDFRSDNDEDTVIDLYIPESTFIYSGTFNITSNGNKVYSRTISIKDMEFNDEGRYYQFKIPFKSLQLKNLKSGDILKCNFTSADETQSIAKSVFYTVNEEEDSVRFELIHFKEGNYLDDEVLIEVADFPDGVDDEFKIIVDKWGEPNVLTFKISELERNEANLYVWNCTALDIADFMYDMTDADLEFTFKFYNNGTEAQEYWGMSWVYKNPYISMGEFANTDDGSIISFRYLPEFEGNIEITITKDGTVIKTLPLSRADMDDYYVCEDDEYEGWMFGLKDFELLKQYGTYTINVKMIRDGKEYNYNDTITLVDFVINTRTDLEQINFAVFRIMLDEDASGRVVMYVNGTKVFNKTLEDIGFSDWNRMGGFNIPLNYLQINESGSYEITLDVDVYDDGNVVSRSIKHNITIEVAPNHFEFADIGYHIFEDDFLYLTRLTFPVPVDAEFVLYIDNKEVGRTKITCDEFRFLDLDASLLDEFGRMKAGTYLARIDMVSGENVSTVLNSSFSVLTKSGDVKVSVPSTSSTTGDLQVTVNVPKPDESYIDNLRLTIFVDPYMNGEDMEWKDIFEMEGWELKDFLEKGNNVNLGRLSAGSHKLLVQYFVDVDDYMNYPFLSNFFTVTVNKAASQITAPAVTSSYKDGKKLVITLKDAKGKIISGKKITVKVGTISKTLTTNKKGQISIVVSSLVPKTYKATIKFAGDSIYKTSSKTVKVVVKKAKTKLTAKKVKVKAKVKAKKVVAVLKFNGNKALKGKKVTLKIKGKTYKAKTNKKGKAVFKVKNLKKKGKFTGIIKFKGDKYFKASSKKVKVIVK